MTVSGLGQAEALKEKEACVPDRKKRTALQATLRATLPDLSINLGGTTPIDVTRAGVDKGYVLKRFCAESGFPLARTLFICNAIFPGGNYYPAAEIGLDTVTHFDVTDTTAVVYSLIACLHQ